MGNKSRSVADVRLLWLPGLRRRRSPSSWVGPRHEVKTEHRLTPFFGSYRVACWGPSRYAEFVLAVIHGSAWERRDKGNQRFWNHRCTQMHADKSHIACACVGARSMAGAEILISVYLCASVVQNTWLLSLAISAPIVFARSCSIQQITPFERLFLEGPAARCGVDR